MQEKRQEGIAYLLTLGELIQNEGQEKEGDLLITPLDYHTFCAVESILDVWNTNPTKLPYTFLYDDAYYLQENGVLHESDFNQYVKGMIVKKSVFEKNGTLHSHGILKENI